MNTVPTSLPRAPALFVSHGSPEFALAPGAIGPKLSELGASIAPPEAVLVVSPHWMTSDLQVMASAQPDTIHDFSGFSPELYRLRYPAPGHPALAAETATLLQANGFSARLDTQRGLDHGAWVPLRYLFPHHDVPVFQVSLPQHVDPGAAYLLGQALAPLRDRGVMILGSGSLTHNLYEVFRGRDIDGAYARDFVRWAREAVQGRNIDALIDYRRRAPQAERAHPTAEHYLPLLVAAGAGRETDTIVAIDGGMTHGVLSMDAFLWSPT